MATGVKHIGILAHSAEGSALCYLTACHQGARQLGEHMHPDITLSIIPMGISMPAWRQFDLPAIWATLNATAERLLAAGCDFFICPDNTAHLAFEAVDDPLPLPGLHIAEVVVDHAAKQGHQKIGLLGTKWTMEGTVYRNAAARRGQELYAPAPEDMAFVDRVIFDELCNGLFRDQTREEYLRIISGFADQGCTSVILGCTEIPLLLTPDISPVPLLDSTRLLAAAAIEVAIGSGPIPSWRGGPITG